MNMSSLEQRHRDEQIASLKESIHATYDAVKVNGKLPKNLFDKWFFPFFSGEKDFAESPDAYATWIGIAGGVTGEVDILDNHGNVLFTVPAMMDTTNITTNGSGNALSPIMTHAGLLTNQSPHAAKAFVVGSLGQIAQQYAAPDMTEKEKRWEMIFRLYGLAPQKAIDAKVGAAEQFAEDTLDYDD